MRMLYLAVLIVSLLGSARPLALAQELDESTYHSRQLQLKLEVPEGWLVVQQTGYPSLDALLVDRSGQVSISLASGRLAPHQTLAAFVAANQAALSMVGLRVLASQSGTQDTKQLWRLDLVPRRGRVALRQVYLAHGQQVIILTLVAPAQQMTNRQPDLAAVVESLELSWQPSQGRTSSSASAPSLPEPADDEDAEVGSLPNQPAPSSQAPQETTSRPAKQAPDRARPPAQGPTSLPHREPGDVPTTEPSDEL